MDDNYVRRIDKIGRIVLPAETRTALGWDCETKITVKMEKDSIILSKKS